MDIVCFLSSLSSKITTWHSQSHIYKCHWHTEADCKGRVTHYIKDRLAQAASVSYWQCYSKTPLLKLHVFPWEWAPCVQHNPLFAFCPTQSIYVLRQDEDSCFDNSVPIMCYQTPESFSCLPLGEDWTMNVECEYLHRCSCCWSKTRSTQYILTLTNTIL